MVNRRDFNRQLKAIMAKLHVPQETRYSSHAYRRGATLELKDCGSPWSAVAASGIWNSHSFRVYIDMPRGVEMGAHQLHDVDFDSESDAGEVRRWVFAGGGPLGRPVAAALPWVTGFPVFSRGGRNYSCAL